MRTLWPAEKAIAEQSVADEEFVNSLNARISEIGSIRDSFDETMSSPTSSFQEASDSELAQQFNERLGEVSSSEQELREQLTGNFSFCSLFPCPAAWQIDLNNMFKFHGSLSSRLLQDLCYASLYAASHAKWQTKPLLSSRLDTVAYHAEMYAEVFKSSFWEGVPFYAGQVLRDLVFAKYGKQYDLSIVRRQIAGVTIVALNVMWTHLDQRSFPMSEPEFMDKLDTIAEYLRQASLACWRHDTYSQSCSKLACKEYWLNDQNMSFGVLGRWSIHCTSVSVQHTCCLPCLML